MRLVLDARGRRVAQPPSGLPLFVGDFDDVRMGYVSSRQARALDGVVLSPCSLRPEAVKTERLHTTLRARGQARDRVALG